MHSLSNSIEYEDSGMKRMTFVHLLVATVLAVILKMCWNAILIFIVSLLAASLGALKGKWFVLYGLVSWSVYWLDVVLFGFVVVGWGCYWLSQYMAAIWVLRVCKGLIVAFLIFFCVVAVI